jgi:hypothetical protein
MSHNIRKYQWSETGARGGGPGGGTLDEVITGGTPDNDVTVPLANPVILHDDAEAFAPLTVVKTEPAPAQGIAEPGIKVLAPLRGSPGLGAETPDGVHRTALMPGGLIMEPHASAFYNMGPRTRGVANPGDGNDFWVVGGGGYGGGNTGGTLHLAGGAGSVGADHGKIAIGIYGTITDSVEIGAAAVQTNVGGDLDVAGVITRPPQSAVLTRDGNGAVETVTTVGGPTWTISRNPNQSVASLTDTVYLVTVDRDGGGIITGVTATVV